MMNMARMHWTGHPFVDAGLAALAAKVGVQRLEDLTPEHLKEAVKALERVLLSDQALGIGVAKAFAKGAMSQLFPNSELVNPSNWKGKTAEEKAESVRRKFREALASELQRAQQCLQTTGGEEVCFACGERRPKEAMETRRKDKMPLLEGIVNFYPAFAYGVRICGMCALAVRFLPLSVMRTGAQNRLWFLHTQALAVAAAITRTYGWEHFNRLIAANETLDFFSSWETAGAAGTVLYLLCELLEHFGGQVRAIYQSPLPTTAYIFSNDNRGGFVQALLIPNDLLRFLAKLQLESDSAFQLFWRELLQVSRGLNEKERKARSMLVQTLAQRLLNGDALLGSCLDHDVPQVHGGWVGHRLYLREVRGMATGKLTILERLGIAIAQSGDAKKHLNELRAAQWNELYDVLLGYVRRSWLKHDEFYSLLPPNDYGAAGEVRDVLLAVAYEWQRSKEQGREFPALQEQAKLSSDETLSRLQQIGERLVARLPNLSRWVAQLQTARQTERIRGVYLSAVRSGAMGFADFVFLAPLGDKQSLWLLRDYLLAFLFDRAGAELPQEEGSTAGLEQVSAEVHDGGAL
jgi:CRISPR-associated protein Cst1